jgi:hypothetical protein
VNHCLDRALYRGRAKMQMQVYMISIVHNLKRLAFKAAKEALAFVANVICILMRLMGDAFSSEESKLVAA